MLGEKLARFKSWCDQRFANAMDFVANTRRNSTETALICLVPGEVLSHQLEEVIVPHRSVRHSPSFTSMKIPPLLTLAALLVSSHLHATTASPIDPNALSMLKRMSTALSQAKAFTFRSSSIIEVPAFTGQSVTLFSVGEVALKRPAMLRARLGGDAPAFDFYYDGTSVSALAPQTKVFSTAKAPATIDEMLAGLRHETGIRFPSAPLLYSDPYAILTRNLQSAVVIGPTSVNGIACDHLAFRSPGVNWEIWIDAGPAALPRRLAVTFTDKPNFPRTIIKFSHWNVHPWLFNSSFVFHKPEGVREIPFAAVLHSADR